MTEHASPRAALTNSAFLTELATALPQGASMWVTSFLGSPDLTEVGNWFGKPYNAQRMAGMVDRWGDQNTYYSVAAVHPTADGEVRRRKANFARLLALVVDDVLLEDVQGQVSYVLQTSPGKTQVGILLDGADPDCADIGLVDRLVTTMAERGLLRADISGNNAVRYVRLPLGQNQKPRPSGHFDHQLAQWNPRVRLSLADAAAAFGMDLDELRGQVARQPTSTSSLAGQDEKLEELIGNVLRGDGLHESLNRIASSLVATGMPGGATVNVLRGLMKHTAAPHDERWLARYQDIPRSVTTAQEKFSRPAPEPVHQLSDLVLDVQQLDREAESVSWAVKFLVPERSVGFFFGASGTFKSFIALDYALHRAYGMKWLGQRTKQAIPVYLAAEGGVGLIKRIKAWHMHHRMDWRRCPIRVVPVALTLNTQARELREAIEATGVQPGDIIVDTFSQTYAGKENSAEEVAAFLRLIGSELRDQLRCTVGIVHHSGHAEAERMRGSSAMGAGVDWVFGVFREPGEMLATMENTKQKDDATFAPVTFSLHRHELGKDQDGDLITSLAAAQAVDVAEIIATATKKTDGQRAIFLRLLGETSSESQLRTAFYSELGEMNATTKRTAWFKQRKFVLDNGIAVAGEGRLILVDKSHGDPHA